jgi:hypothetical protein
MDGDTVAVDDILAILDCDLDRSTELADAKVIIMRLQAVDAVSEVGQLKCKR